MSSDIHWYVKEFKKFEDDKPFKLSSNSNIQGANFRIARVLDSSQGKYEEILTAYQEVLDKQKQIFGTDNPDTLTTINNLALVLDSQGKYEEALKLYHEVLDKQKQILGTDHPDTLTTMNNIAFVLENQGKYEEALKLYQVVLDKKIDIGPW